MKNHTPDLCHCQTNPLACACKCRSCAMKHSHADRRAVKKIVRCHQLLHPEETLRERREQTERLQRLSESHVAYPITITPTPPPDGEEQNKYYCQLWGRVIGAPAYARWDILCTKN